MPYKIHLAAENGEPVEITAKPTSLDIELKEETWSVCATWCRRALSDDPESFLAVTRAWPGREDLSLTGRDNAEVFSGKVTKVGFTDEHITLEAANPQEPSDEVMEMTVEGDAANPMQAVITVDNKGHGPVTITFGDGSPDEQNPGDGVTQTFHVYAVENVYDLTVWDVDDPARNFSNQVAVPFPAGS
jgi:hypothetical protein